MKKLKMMFAMVVAMMAMTTISMADTADLGAVVVRGHEWRGGVGMPVLNFRDYDVPVSLDVWGLTDDKAENLYLGGGLSLYLTGNKNLNLAATAGWSGRFQGLRNFDMGDAAAGVMLNGRF